MLIRARRLLDFPLQELWDNLNGEITLLFDNGEEVPTAPKDILYSLYVWRFHREYNFPLLPRHLVRSVLGTNRLQSSTHLKIIGVVLWDAYDHIVSTQDLSEQDKVTLRYKLAELGYAVTNDIYNDLILRLEDHVTSLDITDFFEVMEHPDIQKAYETLEPTERSIEDGYNVVYKTLRDNKTLGHNPLSLLVQSNLVSEKQVHQVLFARGFLTDSDSDIFDIPVMRGYAEGIRSFYDSLVESRSAVKALIFSKTPLQDAEYFSRRLQLVSMGVATLHHVDCGSTKHLEWQVRGKETVDGRITYDGDLKQLAGKYYMDETTGSYLVIKPSDRHLVGKRIKLRTVLHCMHPDPSGICQVCFGTLSESVPVKSNIGHMCSTYMTQQSSQAVLSVKHLDGSASLEVVVLSEADRHYLQVMHDGNSYRLSDLLKTKRVSLVIPASAAPTIADVMEVEEITDLTVSRISNLEYIDILIDDGKMPVQATAEVHVKKRQSSMTHELLQHIRENGWDTDQAGNYVIDMTNWDWSKPILQLPLRHANMSDHSKEIAEVLESCVDNMIERDRFSNPSTVLVELFTLVNEKLAVNLAILEVVLYGAMIVSAEDFDYSLPKPWTKAGLGVMRNTMNYRSLSPRMAFERHRDVLVHPESYVLTNRADHLFDYVLMPREKTMHDQMKAQQLGNG